jgi:DNA polymerase-1
MNFQNIPRDDKVVKRAFVPREGNVFHMLDYKQIEPRLLAYFAAKKGDQTLAQRIRDGLDPYTAILRSIYGENITDEQRQEGKILFLSLMYGGGVRTVKAQFGLNEAEAKAMIRNFHKQLPIVRKLQDGVVATASQRGYIRTPWGRPLHLEEYGEHKLLNKLIQGSAAHLMKRAMIRVDRVIGATGGDVSWGVGGLMGLSVVHDEIILESTHAASEWVHETIPPLMTVESAGQDICDIIPIQVDHEVAVASMADKRDYEEYRAIPY